MRDRYEVVAGSIRPPTCASVWCTRPYLRVMNAFAADGTDLVIAGHTHGGQLCLPGGGRSSPTATFPEVGQWAAHVRPTIGHHCPRRTGGPRTVVGAGPGPNRPLMHVSAGLGTSPYAPVRFSCPPEATILTLTA